MYFQFSEIDENPFLNYGEYFYNDRNAGSSIDCFLDHVVFRNNLTNEEFRPNDKGRCYSYSHNSLYINFSSRDHFRMVTAAFLSNNHSSGSDSFNLEMYFDDPSQLPLELPAYTSEAPLALNANSYLSDYIGLNQFDFWLNERIVLLHFGTVVSTENVNISMTFTNNYYGGGELSDINNTVITDAEVLSNHPSGLTKALAIKLSLADFNEMMSKGICTADNSVNRNCYLSLASGFATSFYGVPSYQTQGYSTSSIRVNPPGKTIYNIIIIRTCMQYVRTCMQYVRTCMHVRTCMQYVRTCMQYVHTDR